MRVFWGWIGVAALAAVVMHFGLANELGCQIILGVSLFGAGSVLGVASGKSRGTG